MTPDLIRHLELVERLQAIIEELSPGGDGPEVARCIAEGAIEVIENQYELGGYLSTIPERRP